MFCALLSGSSLVPGYQLMRPGLFSMSAVLSWLPYWPRDEIILMRRDVEPFSRNARKVEQFKLRSKFYDTATNLKPNGKWFHSGLRRHPEHRLQTCNCRQLSPLCKPEKKTTSNNSCWNVDKRCPHIATAQMKTSKKLVANSHSGVPLNDQSVWRGYWAGKRRLSVDIVAQFVETKAHRRTSLWPLRTRLEVSFEIFGWDRCTDFDLAFNVACIGRLEDIRHSKRRPRILSWCYIFRSCQGWNVQADRCRNFGLWAILSAPSGWIAPGFPSSNWLVRYSPSHVDPQWRLEHRYQVAA